MAVLHAENFQDNSGKYFGDSGCDNGQALNNLWAQATDDCTIIILPGDYSYTTPIVWSGKRFNCIADGVTLNLLAPTGAAGFTIGETDHCYIRGLYIWADWRFYLPANSIGLKLSNVSNSTFERMHIYNWQVGIQQYADTVSHFNILRDCWVNSLVDSNDFTKRATSVQTLGVNSGHMRISGGDYSGMSTVFDFRVGCGGNHVIGPSTQTSIWGVYLMRSGSNGNNFLRCTYFEGPGGPNANYPESVYSPYDTTYNQGEAYSAPCYSVEFAGDNNIVWLPYGGVYVIDTGSNNLVINNSNENLILQTH